MAGDLFFLPGNVAVLHIIDKFPLFSMCSLLKSKTAVDVCTAFLRWVTNFGASINALGYGGGEFDNDLLSLACD